LKVQSVLKHIFIDHWPEQISCCLFHDHLQ